MYLQIRCRTLISSKLWPWMATCAGTSATSARWRSPTPPPSSDTGSSTRRAETSPVKSVARWVFAKDEFNWDFNCIKNSRLFGGKYSTNRLSLTQLNSNMTDMGDRNWFGNRPTEALNGVSVGTFGSITKYGFWRWGKSTSCRRLCRPLREGWVRLGSTELNWKSSWTELKNSRTLELLNIWTHP